MKDEESGAIPIKEDIAAEDPKEDDGKGTKEQVSLAEVFSFVTNGTVKLQIVGAIVCACLSGLVLPGMHIECWDSHTI